MVLRGPRYARSRARRTTRLVRSHSGPPLRAPPSDWLLHHLPPFHWAGSCCLLKDPGRASDGHYERVVAHDAQR